MRAPFLACLLCLFLTAPALAQDGAGRREMILRAAREFIIPRYEALAKATKDEQEAWSRFCAAPRRSGRSGSRRRSNSVTWIACPKLT